MFGQAARRVWVDARTVLAGKGPLRRAAKPARPGRLRAVLAKGRCDGRLRREHDPTRGLVHGTGWPNGQEKIGHLHKTVDTPQQDYFEAAKWYRKAAEQGDAPSQAYLGLAYARGQGVPLDFAEAARWFRKAAALGNATAEYNLGLMYGQGLGVQQDYAEAIRWYLNAVEKGSTAAQTNLGVMYKEGHGVQQDFAEAVHRFRSAAEQGDATAQYNLGSMYGQGQGVPQDYVQAHMWMNLAASRATGEDQRKFAQARDFFEVKMTAQQLAEAQRLAREWKPKSGVDPVGRPTH